jgi:hypothetical protein
MQTGGRGENLILVKARRPAIPRHGHFGGCKNSKFPGIEGIPSSSRECLAQAGLMMCPRLNCCHPWAVGLPLRPRRGPPPPPRNHTQNQPQSLPLRFFLHLQAHSHAVSEAARGTTLVKCREWYTTRHEVGTIVNIQQDWPISCKGLTVDHFHRMLQICLRSDTNASSAPTRSSST